MTSTQAILQKLDTLTREVRDLKKSLTSQKETWLSEKQAAEFLGMSQDNLRKMRYSGRIPVHGYRARNSGRGYQYKKSEIEKQFAK